MNLPAVPEDVNSHERDRIPALERIEERTAQPITRLSALERIEDGTPLPRGGGENLCAGAD